MVGRALALAAALVCGVACESRIDPRGAEPLSREAGDESANAAVPRTQRPACDARHPLREAWFGDLHVHTALSMDAYMFETRVRPDDAYRFARGETIELPPLDPAGRPTRPVHLERPLDFAAVTDHAVNFGAVRQCTTPGSSAYDTSSCRLFRQRFDPSSGDLEGGVREITERTEERLGAAEVCREDGGRCRDAASDAWDETRFAAARHQDPTPACTFTTFVAYEYTATPEFTKVHRNVIFRNEEVPALPVSYGDEPTAIGLWRRLRAECQWSGRGCDVLAIPHNANLSNGQLFALEYGDATSLREQAAIASLRAQMEPLVEVMQMKGDSECRNGLWRVLGGPDELCGFEKLRPPQTPDCRDGRGEGALLGKGCVSRLDYARYALVEGLREAERLGVNPYRFGMIASTDNHDATAGAVEEHRLDLWTGRPGSGRGMNAGGLAAVWAEENSREAIFQALRRRETFGTSGPRMRVRFFGGWDLDPDLCDDPELVARAYAGGVPMGGELPAPNAGREREPGRAAAAPAAAPVFVAHALRDPGTDAHPGGLLQRVQIVKGWAGEDGRIHQAVYDVAGDPDNGADVDVDRCEPRGPGHARLCAVWRDPAFEPGRRAVYYARVVENPSCRSSGHACAAAARSGAPRPAFCDDDAVPKTVQERAWTSPIWYAPAARS